MYLAFEIKISLSGLNTDREILLIGKRCVGVGLPDDPNRVCATFLVKTDVIAKPVRTLVVAIRTLSL